MLASHIFSALGKLHASSGMLCEDVILTAESDNFCFYGLADGQSRKKYCVEGAKASLTTAAAYLKEQEISRLHRVRYFDEIQYGLIRAIRTELESKTDEYNTDIFEFGSTLIALAIDPDNGKYVLIHLGDGRVSGIDRSGRFKNLSFPENGLCRNQTWLTTSLSAANHIRIYTGNINNYRRIIIMSDGADNIFHREALSQSALCLPACDGFKPLLSHRALDDASCIVIDNDAAPSLLQS